MPLDRAFGRMGLLALAAVAVLGCLWLGRARTAWYPMSTPPLYVIDLGRRGYDEVHQLQRDLADRRIAGEISR